MRAMQQLRLLFICNVTVSISMHAMEIKHGFIDKSPTKLHTSIAKDELLRRYFKPTPRQVAVQVFEDAKNNKQYSKNKSISMASAVYNNAKANKLQWPIVLLQKRCSFEGICNLALNAWEKKDSEHAQSIISTIKKREMVDEFVARLYSDAQKSWYANEAFECFDSEFALKLMKSYKDKRLAIDHAAKALGRSGCQLKIPGKCKTQVIQEFFCKQQVLIKRSSYSQAISTQYYLFLRNFFRDQQQNLDNYYKKVLFAIDLTPKKVPEEKIEKAKRKHIPTDIQNNIYLFLSVANFDNSKTLYLPLRKAIVADNVPEVFRLLDLGCSGVAYDNTQRNPLELAIKIGKTKCVSAIVSHGVPKLAQYIDQYKKLAQENDHKDLVAYLTDLDSQLKKHSKDFADDCMGYYHTNIVQAMQRGIDPNTKGADGLPLFWSMYEKYTAILELLLENGANPNAKDGSDNPLLYRATWDRYANLEVIELLLKHKADPNVKIGYWASILGAIIGGIHERKDQDAIAIIELFLKYNANPNAMYGLRNFTLLQLAIEKHDPHIVHLLLRSKADPNYKPGFFSYSLLDQVYQLQKIDPFTKKLIISRLKKYGARRNYLGKIVSYALVGVGIIGYIKILLIAREIGIQHRNRALASKSQL